MKRFFAGFILGCFAGFLVSKCREEITHHDAPIEAPDEQPPLSATGSVAGNAPTVAFSATLGRTGPASYQTAPLVNYSEAHQNTAEALFQRAVTVVSRHRPVNSGS
jgi:hypothetical protein